MVRNWKKRAKQLSEIESEFKEPQPQQWEEPLIIKKNYNINGKNISKRDAQLLFFVKDQINQYKKFQITKRRALTIKNISANNFSIKQNSTEDFVYKLLLQLNDYISIPSIIEKIEEFGWKSNSKYHKYNSVLKIIRDNHFMFERSQKGIKLRDGFKNIQLQKPIIEDKNIKQISKIVSLKEIITNIVCLYNKADINIDFIPARIYQVMLKMGYNCSESGVRKAIKQLKMENSK